MEDAIYPVGELLFKYGKQVENKQFGDIFSEGILCDGVMLSWPQSLKGELIKLDPNIWKVGGKPPIYDPRPPEKIRKIKKTN